MEHHYDVNIGKLEKAQSLFMSTPTEERLFDMTWTKLLGRTSYGWKQGESHEDWFSMRIHMNPQITLIKKSVYTAFDFLRDVGGLTFACVLFATGLAHGFTYNKMENQMVAQLYRKPKSWVGFKDQIREIPKNLNADS